MVDFTSGNSENRIASKDAAQTFEESDVTVQTTNTFASGGSVSFVSPPITRDEDEDGYSLGQRRGLKINLKTDVVTVAGKLSTLTDGVTKVYLTDLDGNVIAETGVNGNSFNIGDLSLQSGESYYVTADNDGDSYYVGVKDNADFPYSAPFLDITSGVYSGNEESNKAYNIASVSVTTSSQSGECVVEWPKPTDLYRWDAATFQTTEEGETVEVYVEESTDGGSTWTQIQGPISRGDQIEAEPSSRVRFRVELARNDPTNKPSLDAIYRRWVL